MSYERYSHVPEHNEWQAWTHADKWLAANFIRTILGFCATSPMAKYILTYSNQCWSVSSTYIFGGSFLPSIKTEPLSGWLWPPSSNTYEITLGFAITPNVLERTDSKIVLYCEKDVWLGESRQTIAALFSSGSRKNPFFCYKGSRSRSFSSIHVLGQH